MKHKQGICPHCQAKLDGKYEQYKFYDNLVKFNWTCYECGKNGTETYKLVFVKHEQESETYDIRFNAYE